MLRELRKKFILIVMGSMFGIFFLLLFAINAFNIATQQQKISHTMETLVENGGQFPIRDMHRDPQPPPTPGFSNLWQQSPETPFMVRYCCVYLDRSGTVTQVFMDHIAALSQEDAISYAQTVFSQGDSQGQIGGYRFQLSTWQENYLLILLDTSTEEQNMFSLLLISCIIGIGAYLVVFALVVLFSKRAVKPIAESYEKQKQFIADVSHELKTPLTVISADSEILSMTFGKNEWCEGIDKQTAKMRHLISRMLTLTRMDAETSKTEHREFSISEAVYDTAMSFAPLAQRSGKKFSVDIAPDLMFTGNEGEIRQCVSILLDNAVKYCDENGEISVSLRREKRLQLDVVNTYQQAAKLEYRKLFDRFYRADEARSIGNSYGLGLSIARSIVQRHRGNIRACPQGRGAILFRVTLPS